MAHPARRLVVVPVFNEAASVEGVLHALLQHAAEAGADVLVVDDGSTDATPQLLQSFRGRVAAILRHPVNEGYGQALRDGFAWATDHGYGRVVTIDCDEQHEPALVPAFFAALDDHGADIVSGSRYLTPPPVATQPPPDRLAINREITQRVNALTGFGITDAFCGFKGYRVGALERLHLRERGYAFPIEVWVEAWRHGLRVIEIPVPLIYKPNFERRFGGNLDDPSQRRRYYVDVFQRTLREVHCRDADAARAETTRARSRRCA